MKRLLLLAASAAAIAACTPADTTNDPAETVSPAESASEVAAPRFGSFGFEVAGMDRAVHPGNDFDRFANGAWLDATEIPSDRSRYGMFDMLSLENEERIAAIIEDASAGRAGEGRTAEMIGTLYASWMDADAIEAAGLEPAAPFLAEIAAIETHDDAAALFATVHHHSPYGFFVWADPSNPEQNALRMSQGGLGMGERSYYLDEGERFAEYRAAYLEYIRTIFDLAGLDFGDSAAEDILALETRIAEAHWTRERSRQITETYNVMSVAELDALAPALKLADGMAALGLDVEQLIVAQPSAIEGTAEAFAGTDIETIKAWMALHFISNRASWLPAAFDEASFDFFSRTLRGQAEQRSRDRRGVQLVNGALGDAIGQIYLDRHFPPSSKDQMDELVQTTLTSFRGRLEQLDWMDQETREQALLKLSTFEPRIGVPEVFETYEGLDLSADSYFAKRLAMSEWQWAEQLEDLGEPVDPREWGLPTQIVNAFYSPLQNQITFPAGILQAPFFDPAADPAINFGAIGGVIGHEIGHGFDDQGRRYDESGRLRDWWSEETNARFEERAATLGAQYDEFCPFDDLCVNGRLAMGENIGDLGGLQMAYTAWREYVDTHYGGEAPVIDGFTGDQRFFLAWAQVWRAKYTEDALRSQLVNGPHSPPRYRINGVVRNLDAWYDAFGITEEHELYLPPEQRVRIW